jgi:hypothetical protein
MANGQKSVIILTYRRHKLLDLDTDCQNSLSILFPFTFPFNFLTNIGKIIV